MSSNKSNNLYNLEAERKRLAAMRRRNPGSTEKTSAVRRAVKAKVVLYGQVAFFLIMVGLLMHQCRGG